jgi:anti-sigma regulatory factor (Ser/Thr protein kinase)
LREVAMNELTIEAKLENIDAVLDFINERIGGCPMKVQNQIGIAGDEIFSNIARFAYHPNTGDATIRVAAGAGNVTIEFADNGTAYDPLSAPPPDTALTAEEREIGGLGIFLVRNIMDSVEYRREDGKNILMVKIGYPAA